MGTEVARVADYLRILLVNRGLGQFGFFHLTFEEYLAARQIARQRAEERRAILKAHWEDPRWHEVILLAAGQLGIVEARRDDVSDFVEDLLQMEPTEPADAGRQAVLAGRALADIGPRSVSPRTRRWLLDALRETMQDLNPETGHTRPARLGRAREPVEGPPRIPIRTRYDAGEVLDELGWLPSDLNAWVRRPGCTADSGDLMVMKYPLTNAQYARFILDGGYENPAYWGGEGSPAWRWRVEEHLDYRGEGPVTEPEYWRNPRFGKERRGYPVVGISWYEAMAYAAWLTDVLRRARASDETLAPEDRALVADLLEAGAALRQDFGELTYPAGSTGSRAAQDVAAVRLPTDGEWEAVAGGTGDENRYPWDPPAGPPRPAGAPVPAALAPCGPGRMLAQP